MTVEPGFGGQSFIYETLDKISELNALRNKYNPGLLIEVDGGINPETGKLCVQSGADVLVTGNYFFKSDDRKIASDLLHFKI
jgi:Pentose-5-phosphate-3-epimerase